MLRGERDFQRSVCYTGHVSSFIRLPVYLLLVPSVFEKGFETQKTLSTQVFCLGAVFRNRLDLIEMNTHEINSDNIVSMVGCSLCATHRQGGIILMLAGKKESMPSSQIERISYCWGKEY